MNKKVLDASAYAADSGGGMQSVWYHTGSILC